MKKLSQILSSLGLATTLILSGCTATQNSFMPFETNDSRKVLVRNHEEVIANAKKHSLKVYVLKNGIETVGTYAEGVAVEEREKLGKVEFGYECSDNFYLFDDNIFNGVRTFNGKYYAEKY